MPRSCRLKQNVVVWLLLNLTTPQDTPAQKIECEKASGSFLDPSTEKASRLEKLRQEVRDKMTKPLSAESRRSDEGQQASVTEKLPGVALLHSESEKYVFGYHWLFMGPQRFFCF